MCNSSVSFPLLRAQGDFLFLGMLLYDVEPLQPAPQREPVEQSPSPTPQWIGPVSSYAPEMQDGLLLQQNLAYPDQAIPVPGASLQHLLVQHK